MVNGESAQQRVERSIQESGRQQSLPVGFKSSGEKLIRAVSGGGGGRGSTPSSQVRNTERQRTAQKGNITKELGDLIRKERVKLLQDVRGLSRQDRLKLSLQVQKNIANLGVKAKQLKIRINQASGDQLTRGFSLIEKRTKAPTEIDDGRIPLSIAPVEKRTTGQRLREFGRKVSTRAKEVFLEEQPLERQAGQFLTRSRVDKIPQPILLPDFKAVPSQKDEIVPTGTTITDFTIQEKTFFEKIGAKPNKSSQTLKGEVENIQSNFNSGSINEVQANNQLKKASDDFTKREILKGTPKNVAFGLGFALLQAVPVVGQVAGGLLFSNLFLQRRNIFNQFKKFPKESAISTAGFLAGGLAGTKIVSGVKGGARPELNLQNTESFTKLSSSSKVKLSKSFAELDSGFKVAQNKGSISDTIAYQVLLKDGRKFNVLEFTKLDKFAKDGVRGRREFVGFELNPKISGVKIGGRVKTPREVLIGRGVTELKTGGTETFIRVIKFTPKASRIGRIAQKLFGGGKIFDIVERSKVVGTKGRFNRITKVESQARVLSVKKLEGALLRQISKVEKKINQGNRLSFSELKNLINLEKRINGKEIFTDREFRSAGIRSVSDITVVSLFTLFKRVRSKANAREITTIIQKERSTGFVKTVPVATPPPKTKVAPRDRASNTLAEVKRNVQQLSKSVEQGSKTKNVLLNNKQFQQTVNKIKQLPSSAVTLAISLVQKQKNPTAKANVKLGASAVGFNIASQSFAQLQNTMLLQAQQQRSLVRQSTISGSAQQSQQLQKVTQQLQQRLKQIQLLRQRLLQRGGSRAGGGIVRAPISLKVPAPFSGFGKKPKKKGVVSPIVPSPPQKGFNVQVRRRGKFSQINKNPLSKNRARDLGAFAVDKSLGRSFRLSSTNKGAKKSVFKFPPNYFANTSRKYRFAKKDKSIFVERSRFALDSSQEKKNIRVAKLLARIRKGKALPSPFRKKIR